MDCGMPPVTRAGAKRKMDEIQEVVQVTTEISRDAANSIRILIRFTRNIVTKNTLAKKIENFTRQNVNSARKHDIRYIDLYLFKIFTT